MTIKEFIAQQRISMSCEYADANPNMDSANRDMNHWRCTLKMGRKRMVVPVSQGSAIRGEPKLADVLDCLASDASSATQDFESWASEYGYDTDSRKAERTYQTVQRQTTRLDTFLGTASLMALLDCERE